MRLLLLIPMLFIRIPADAQVNDPFIADFLSKWNNAFEYTLEYAEALPASAYNYKPTAEQREFHGQLTHMCGNMIWLSTTYLGGPGLEHSDMDNPPEDKEGVIRLLKNSFEYARTTVEALDPAELDDMINFFAGPMSKRKVLLLMADHVTHHRGQLAVYLRLNGIEPPRYRGW